MRDDCVLTSLCVVLHGFAVLCCAVLRARQEVNATVLVSYGVAAALQIVSNMNNQSPALAHMSRANDIISLYQTYNARHMAHVPCIDVTTTSLSNLRSIAVMSESNVFPADLGFPPGCHSMNFRLQVCNKSIDSYKCMMIVFIIYTATIQSLRVADSIHIVSECKVSQYHVISAHLLLFAQQKVSDAMENPGAR
jgi:hypothetical protein